MVNLFQLQSAPSEILDHVSPELRVILIATAVILSLIAILSIYKRKNQRERELAMWIEKFPLDINIVSESELREILKPYGIPDFSPDGRIMISFSGNWRRHHLIALDYQFRSTDPVEKPYTFSAVLLINDKLSPDWENHELNHGIFKTRTGPKSGLIISNGGLFSMEEFDETALFLAHEIEEFLGDVKS